MDYWDFLWSALNLRRLFSFECPIWLNLSTCRNEDNIFQLIIESIFVK